MMEDRKRLTRDELDIMTHEGDAYIEHLKTSLARMKKYKGYIKSRTPVVTDKEEIVRKGFTTHVANGDLRFDSIVYSYTGLGKLLSPKGTVTSRWECDNSGPIAIFQGYVPYQVGLMKEPKYRWRPVYLYEEVLVITKWYDKHYERSSKFRTKSPEYFYLYNELEDVRNEIKRRAKDGKPTIWTGFGDNRESE